MAANHHFWENNNVTEKASVLFQNPQWKKKIKTPSFKLFFYASEMKQRQKPCWYSTLHESTHLILQGRSLPCVAKVMHWVMTCISFPEPVHSSTGAEQAPPASRSSAGLSELLCPLRVLISFCALHTPSLQWLCSSLLKTSPSFLPKF